MRLLKSITAGLTLAALPASTGLFAQTTDFTPTAASMTMALTGDSIITQRLSPYKEPQFLKMIDLIRSADVAFTNFEMLFHDWEGHPAAQSGGTYMRAEPALAKELAWAGIDVVGLANNHTGDFSHESMVTTAKALDAVGIVHAGTGDNLQQAREARYADTPSGRVAIISTSSSFPPHSRAGHQRSDVRGRPGLNPLRFTTTYYVPESSIARLKALAGQVGVAPGTNANEITFMTNRFVAAAEARVETVPHAGDFEAIKASIRDAKTMSEYVIVSIHSHEAAPGDRFGPAEFFVTFARGAIDAGASTVVGHGPHYLKGIEIYKGKPIFYGLGDFIFQNDTVLRLPADNYEPYNLDSMARVSDFNARRYNNDTTGFPANPMIWESVVAMPVYKGDKLTELKLHPITLGYGKPSGRRGRPMLADPVLGKKIIDDLIKFSAPYGTKITFQDGVGIVEIPQ